MATRTDKTPELTIVIGTLNRPEIMRKLLNQLQKQKSVTFEVLVYDQSEQKNYEKLHSVFSDDPRFCHIRMDQPNTIRYLNLGWQTAKAPIVLYLDDDVEIMHHTIAAHVKAYENRNIQGVAGRVINAGESETSTENAGLIQWFGAVFKKNFDSLKKQFVQFPYGCNMSFRKRILKEMRGFDEQLKPPIYSYNEVDLGYRITKKYPDSILFEPNALVYHRKYKSGGTRNYITEEFAQWNSVNYGFFVGKNFTVAENIVWFLRRLAFQITKEPDQIPHIVAGFVQAKKNKITFSNILVGLAVLLIIILRFWKAAQFFSFNFDEEYQASLAWEQVKHFHRIWIGVSASNLSYYLGPAFTYLNAFLFYFTKGDPVILAYFSPLLGIATMISVYYVASRLFSKKIGFIAMTIYGGSTLINFYDRRFWNPTPIMFMSIWMVYSLIRSHKDTRWLILSTILFAFSFHVHLSLMLFIPLLAINILVNIKKISLKTWGLMILSYLVITSPLLVFDFVHNFDNMRAPIRFFTSPKLPEHTVTPAGIQWHTNVYFSTLGRLWFLKLKTNIQDEHTLGQHLSQAFGNPFFILLTIMALMYIMSKIRSNLSIKYIIATVFIFSFVFLLYPGAAAEYYLLGIIVLLPIVIAVLLEKLPFFIIGGILMIFLLLNSSTILNSNQDRYGLTTRKKLISETMKIIDDKPYALETYGKDPRKYHPYGGWRYLFSRYGYVPSQSFADEFFGWIYSKELPNTKPQYTVIITEETTYKPKKELVKQIKEGAFTSYIIKE